MQNHGDSGIYMGEIGVNYSLLRGCWEVGDVAPPHPSPPFWSSVSRRVSVVSCALLPTPKVHEGEGRPNSPPGIRVMASGEACG